jgi:hypothetical protein
VGAPHRKDFKNAGRRTAHSPRLRFLGARSRALFLVGKGRIQECWWCGCFVFVLLAAMRAFGGGKGREEGRAEGGPTKIRQDDLVVSLRYRKSVGAITTMQ